MSPGHCLPVPFLVRQRSFQKTGRGYCLHGWPLRMTAGWHWGQLLHWFILQEEWRSRMIWPFPRLKWTTCTGQNCWEEVFPGCALSLSRRMGQRLAVKLTSEHRLQVCDSKLTNEGNALTSWKVLAPFDGCRKAPTVWTKRRPKLKSVDFARNNRHND
jgi:hypothetical protein